MATRAQQSDFISAIAPAAQASQEKWGVPASITIAQAILESEWGLSGLAKPPNNNLFGIKLSHTLSAAGDPYVRFITTEYDPSKKKIVASFRKFPDWKASVDAHDELLGSLPRYRPCMGVADDPLSFALQLHNCGYATDPNYPSELAGLIKQFNLTQYDAPKARTKGASA